MSLLCFFISYFRRFWFGFVQPEQGCSWWGGEGGQLSPNASRQFFVKFANLKARLRADLLWQLPVAPKYVNFGSRTKTPQTKIPWT